LTDFNLFNTLIDFTNIIRLLLFTYESDMHKTYTLCWAICDSIWVLFYAFVVLLDFC